MTDTTTVNTDTELWRQPTTTDSEGGNDAGMEPYVFMTAGGGIGFNHYGTCVVRSIKDWVKPPQDNVALEKVREDERGRIAEIIHILVAQNKEHSCRFNDGEQNCDCYLEGLNRVLRQLAYIDRK